jgi:hypothetical protein
LFSANLFYYAARAFGQTELLCQPTRSNGEKESKMSTGTFLPPFNEFKEMLFLSLLISSLLLLLLSLLSFCRQHQTVNFPFSTY